MADELPVGRQVAYWRNRRRLSQQVFADRLGKSKSWVDKVERGVRRLDRWSVLREVAEALGVDPGILLGRAAPPTPRRPTDEPPAHAHPGDEPATGVGTVRAALTRHPGLLPPACRSPVDPSRYRVGIAHAEAGYHRADYPSLLRLLPGLLDESHRREVPVDLRVRAYRLTAQVMVKLGTPELAWLAADRGLALATGTDDPVLVAVAALPFGQALRAAGRHRAAFETAITAAHQVAPPTPDSGTPSERSACAALLVQAALAAAAHGDPPTARDLLDDASASTEPDGTQRAAVDAARVTAATALGDDRLAVELHEALTTRPGWRGLPIEHRAACLLDAAGAYLGNGDPRGASRVLLDADRLAPTEVRIRPAGRAVLAEALTRSNAPDPHLGSCSTSPTGSPGTTPGMRPTSRRAPSPSTRS
ncbi:helix-turn-helix domain-containing protein [Micromonospora sp. NPDC000207]|uniref:helix-turn-helix domain-containing protein n=1 Tax=Micromonospora sp. NPDC000207 TaxID=3154246 RepID=UPI003331CECB